MYPSQMALGVIVVGRGVVVLTVVGRGVVVLTVATAY